MSKEKIRLDVIATFENHTQDIFQIILDKNTDTVLKSENDLINHLQDIINYPKDSNLKKLSLCFICNEDNVKKYLTIKKVISNNGKYFFEDGDLIKDLH
jgi:hypothetical protein